MNSKRQFTLSAKFLLFFVLSTTLTYVSCKKKKVTETTPGGVEQQKNYTTARVKNVTIVDIPFLNSLGSNWDPLDGPDIYFRITDTMATTPNFQTGTIDNISPSNLPLIMNPTITHDYLINSPFKVGVFERDDTLVYFSGDLIGEFYIRFANYKSGWPAKILLQHPTMSNVKVELTVEWL
jgi:hypothetical protein